MRSYRKADGRQVASVRKAIRRQARFDAAQGINPADWSALEAAARRALDSNKELLELPEQDRGYYAGVRRPKTIRSPGQDRRR